MKILTTRKELLEETEKIKSKQETIAFVPTMGNLHEGHISLILEGKKHAKRIITSIFVNKKQFGQSEDFANYPRTELEDIEKLKKAQVDIVYIPNSEKEIFGEDFCLKLDIPNLTNCLCGVSRPNFFGGVLAVVMQFFIQIKPDFTIVGKKDYQQFLVISALAKSLNLGIDIIGVATKREENGLAMSSRNNYFKPEDKEKAKFIFEILNTAKLELLNGLTISTVLPQIKLELEKNGIEKLDYLEIRRQGDLNLIETFKQEEKSILFFAGFFKGVRLIDNIELF